MLCSSCEEKRIAGLASELLQRRTRSVKSPTAASTSTDATESTPSEPDVHRAPPGDREDDAEPGHPSSPASPEAAAAAAGGGWSRRPSCPQSIPWTIPTLYPAMQAWEVRHWWNDQVLPVLHLAPWSLHQWWHSLREEHSMVGVPWLPHVTRLCCLTHQFDYQPAAGYVLANRNKH